MLFEWFGETLWPWLELVGVYFASVLVLLGIGIGCFSGIRARRLGDFLSTGFWFAVMRGAILIFTRGIGIADPIEALGPIVMVPVALLGNTALVIILDGVIKGFWVRSWYTAVALGGLLSLTEFVGRALFVSG